MTEPTNKNFDLSLVGISHRFGASEVLKEISLAVSAGEITCLLGPSGSGKSTLLRLVAGLESLQLGEIYLAGNLLARPGNDPPPEKRSIGLVFQDHALFPHLTVAENIAFGLANLSSSKRASEVRERLSAVGLVDFEERYPHTLSGGQQQRVALARALAPSPAVLLLDEPFASVDSTLRKRLREEARLAIKHAGCPCIMVTHDAEEALELGDKIAVIVDGRIVQLDSPEEVWRRPKNRFVAEMFSDMQAIPGEIAEGGVATPFGLVRTAQSGIASLALGTRVYVVVSPHEIILSETPGSAEIRDIRFLGDRYITIVNTGDLSLRVASRSKPQWRPGQFTSIAFSAEEPLVYIRE